MSTKRVCPKCRNSLTVGNKLVLVGKTKNGLKGLVMLNAELGNFRADFSDDFSLVEGNVLKLLCPICHANLSNTKNKNLAEIVYIDDSDEESTIIFSQIFGEHSTYHIEGNKIKESFGKNDDKYKNEKLI